MINGASPPTVFRHPRSDPSLQSCRRDAEYRATCLTMQIKALEDEVGVELLKRNKRNVELTQSGILFLQEADRALAHASRAAEMARQAAQGIVGTLRLGFSAGTVYSGVLARLVTAFRAASPRVSIEPIECHPREQIELLLAEELDLSIGTIFDADIPGALQTLCLAKHPPRIILPRDHPLSDSMKVRPSSVRNELFIGYSGPGSPTGMELTAGVLGFYPLRDASSAHPR